MQVNEVTGHGFSCHSRRPSECRVCKLPAARHAQAEASEAHSVSMWRIMRNPLVTDRMKTYSDRTLNILRRIADLGGKFDSWDRGNRGWHKTAVSILEKDGLFTRVNDGEAPGLFILTDTGSQACAWHGIEIKAPLPGAIVADEAGNVVAEPTEASVSWGRVWEQMTSRDSKPAELDESDIAEDIAQQWCEAGSPRDAQGHPVIDAREIDAVSAEHDALIDGYVSGATGKPTVAVRPGDTVYRDRDGAQGVVRDVLISGDVDVVFVDGSGWVASLTTLAGAGFEVIPAAEVTEGEIWAGTGTVIERTPRPRSFRKVKDTRSARRRRGGK